MSETKAFTLEKLALRLVAVNVIGMTLRQSILHESGLVQVSMAKAFQKICF